MGKPQLAEDALYVLLHCPFGDEERTGDRVVGATLGDEGEDLPFARGERREIVVAPPASENLAYHLGVEHGPARADLFESRDELTNVGHAVFEQVAGAFGSGLQ